MNEYYFHLDHLTVGYDKKPLIKDICIGIEKGEIVTLIGPNGSGKSTLVQHLNGLIEATSGTVYFNGEDIYDKDYDRKKLRSKVGLVFQYPEHQLFETDVFKDVCFGPKNLGLDRKETELSAYKALKMVGLPDEYFSQSPLDLSGGQKRRVAIAGVLAMEPDVLILDAPPAGLDPKGRDEILELIKGLQETGMTIILVSHSMEDAADYAQREIVMNGGQVMYEGDKKEVFSHKKELEEAGLAVPFYRQVCEELADRGFPIKRDLLTFEETKEELAKYPTEDIYIIGGGSIYKQFLSLCDTAHITKVDYKYDADTYFPNLD